MRPERRLALLAALAALAARAHAADEPAPGTRPRPRLVVVLSIDQFRTDYLTRFEDLFLPATSEGRPGGFRALLESGAWMTDARHEHFPTTTGPGHAVLMTGAPPATNGIVSNLWWDRAARRPRYCMEGTGADGKASRLTPSTLLVTTVSDELEVATGGRAKTWSFGLKDRAAMLLAGHVADGVFWFDDGGGVWVTCDAYGGGRVPGWLAKWNEERHPDRDFGSTWEFSAGEPALARLWCAPGDEPAKAFAHRVDAGAPVSVEAEPRKNARYYSSWEATPFANAWVLRTALHCIRSESLGADDVPDLLTVNLSSNDYVGHRFGPDSAEVLDVSVRTDRQIAEFLGGLAETFGPGLDGVVVAVTADHGVASNSVRAARSGIPAGLLPDDDLAGPVSAVHAAAEKALDAALGESDWVDAYVENNVYLSATALAALDPAERRAAEDVVAETCRAMDGVAAAFTRSQLLEGRVPPTRLGRAAVLGFHARRSGDVVVVPAPQWTPMRNRNGAQHGSPWSYDARVPLLLLGTGVRPGRFRAPASTLDLAPTLAELLGVPPPSGSEGRVLDEALR